MDLSLESAEKPVSFAKETGVITVGQYVLIKLPSKGLKIVETRSDGVINLGKFGSFEVNGILGFPFGQSFEISADKKVSPVKSLVFELEEEELENMDQETSRESTPILELMKNSSETNRDIIDIGSKIQGITSEEIELFKKQNNDNGEILISKIIESHKGFNKKTKYSQEKYITRKQQKFMKKFTVEYLSSSNLLKYYEEKDLSKILNLSEETLGLMLNLLDIRPGGKYFVVDETGGLILYAMMERMKGEGLIVVGHENEHPNFNLLQYSNYTESAINSMIKPINWLQFFEPENEKLIFNEQTKEAIEELRPQKKLQYYRRQKRIIEINKTIDFVTGKDSQFDGLLYCSTIYPTTLIPNIITKIKGSRPIVVYNQYKEILVELQHLLSKNLNVLAPSIMETRARPYQTIPGRIHPLMSMRGGGGYLLWGTRVYPKEGGVIAVGRGFVRRNERKKQKLEKEEDNDDNNKNN
ncbi:hypothetical protein PACTADRAFT_44898 [Pachysolen tannophilus NRRL Y-2460]|uniref:tRNA (adenine(58)-N(1))-methyltransferase non-catalytic subunit TRM6 n=1 Tax=Pachysolen tannophilus NRRL Y-2460 TaxID=669874 RepID=A0A1E4TR31_PACTA|nr:hypothetical protein PACTADRAFT_44898 [Pachysolen tannophilus NRRL Y-2460]